MAAFRDIAEDRVGWLKRWQERTGRKVVGCFPMNVPEEILHAAGLLPTVLLGSDAPISVGHQYFHSYLCHPLRSSVDQTLRGELSFLDGLVVADICDQAKRTGDLWHQHFQPPFYFNLYVPKRVNSPLSQDWLLHELNRLRAAVEGFVRHPVADEALRRSIAIYNQNRALLRRLYDLRRVRPELFRTREVVETVTAAMVMPKEEHSALLSQYLTAKEREARPRAEERVRLVLSGNLCEDLEPGVVELIEEARGQVVGDDLFTGSRYFATSVREDGKPLEALAEAFVRGIPCPTKHNSAWHPAGRILELVKWSGAQGVVILMQSFCEIHAWEYPAIKEGLTREGIPHILIETDHSGATGRVKTRLEAFIEMLRGG